MKITNVTVTPFRTWVDRYLNGEPLPRTEIMQTLTTIETDEGVIGLLSRWSGSWRPGWA